MTQKEYELGKVAYDAYCETTDWKSAVSGAQLPQFSATSELIQKAWIAAAKAARKYDDWR